MEDILSPSNDAEVIYDMKNKLISRSANMYYIKNNNLNIELTVGITT